MVCSQYFLLICLLILERKLKNLKFDGKVLLVSVSVFSHQTLDSSGTVGDAHGGLLWQ